MTVKSKVLLPEEVVLGTTYRAQIDLTEEQNSAREEIVAILGERPTGAASAEWAVQYHEMCADAGIPTTHNGLPFNVRLVPIVREQKALARNLGDNLDRLVKVTCGHPMCSVKETMARKDAPGWNCDKHAADRAEKSNRLVVKTTKRQQSA
jgi:hypothetical protein